MATRVCPECGTQYVASVRRCIDCDAMLVDEVGPEGEVVPTVATSLGAGDQIAYELDGWGNQLRVTLSGMLDLHGIAHVWEVGALVVAAPHEEAVDELIAAVEGGEGEELDADVPQVAFEIDGVSADELAALDAELIAAHIPHAWQETGELLVPVESEDEVADIIDAILNPPEDEEGEDGLATQEALSDLYVAVDKLGKDPTEAKLVDRFTTAADALEGRSVPYGMAGKEWEELLAQVERLRTVLDPSTDLGALDDAEPGDEDGDADAETGDDGERGDVADPVLEDAEDEPTEHADTEEVDADADADEDEDADDADAAEDEELDPAAERVERARELIGRLRTRLLDLV